MGADVDVVVDDRPVQEGSALDDDVRPDDRVLADLHTGFDLGVVPDVERSAQYGVRADLGSFGDPHARRDLEAVHLDLDLALEHVGLRLDVALVRAHVLPVALGHVAVDRPAFLHQLGEDVAGPVDRDVGVDVVEDLGLHDVDAGVDGVREHLAPGRLLQEALDLAFLVHDRDAEFQRVRHPGQAHRDQCALLLVEADQVGEVEVGQRIAGNDDEGVILQGLLGILHAAGGPEWLFLVGIGELHPELFAVPEVVLDERRQELHGDHGLAEPVPLEQPEYVLHDRAVRHWQERLGHARGHGTKACALATGHHDGLHVGRVLLER